MAKKEFLVQDDSPVLKEFIKTNSEQLESLVKDSKTAQVSLSIHFKLTLKLRTTPYVMLLYIPFMESSPFRRHTALWWSILERTPKPHNLLHFSRCLGAS